MEQLIKTSAPILAAVAVVLFALPSFVALIKQRGLAKAAIIFASLGLVAFVFEAIAVKVGFLYDGFHYADSVGYRVLGTAPWLIAVAVPPIMLGAYWFASRYTDGIRRVLFSGLLVLLSYVTIAPAVARMNIWNWDSAGLIYDIPFQPFIAWLTLGLLSCYLLLRLLEDENPTRGIAYSGFGLLWFWGGVNIGLEQYVPGAIGIVLGIAYVFCMWREKKSLDKKTTKKAS